MKKNAIQINYGWSSAEIKSKVVCHKCKKEINILGHAGKYYIFGNMLLHCTRGYPFCENCGSKLNLILKKFIKESK